MRKPRYNNSISLNKQIMNTHSAHELHAIVRTKGAGFDFFNISSAIARVPKLVGLAGGVQVSGMFYICRPVGRVCCRDRGVVCTRWMSVGNM
jgi:hypothetical protein